MPKNQSVTRIRGRKKKEKLHSLHPSPSSASKLLPSFFNSSPQKKTTPTQQQKKKTSTLGTPTKPSSNLPSSPSQPEVSVTIGSSNRKLPHVAWSRSCDLRRKRCRKYPAAAPVVVLVRMPPGGGHVAQIEVPPKSDIIFLIYIYIMMPIKYNL